MRPGSSGWPATAGPGLLDAVQLGTLYGTGAPAWFAEESISETGTPVLWRFLRDEAGLAEVTAEGVVAAAVGRVPGRPAG